MATTLKEITTSLCLPDIDMQIASHQAEQAHLMSQLSDLEARMMEEDGKNAATLRTDHARILLRSKVCEYEMLHLYTARRDAIEKQALEEYKEKLRQYRVRQKSLEDRRTKLSDLRNQLDAAEQALRMAVRRDSATRLQLRQAEKRLQKLGIDPEFLKA